MTSLSPSRVSRPRRIQEVYRAIDATPRTFGIVFDGVGLNPDCCHMDTGDGNACCVIGLERTRSI